MARHDPDQEPAPHGRKAVDRKIPAYYLSTDAMGAADRPAYHRQLQHAERIRTEHRSRSCEKGRS